MACVNCSGTGLLSDGDFGMRRCDCTDCVECNGSGRGEIGGFDFDCENCGGSGIEPVSAGESNPSQHGDSGLSNSGVHASGGSTAAATAGRISVGAMSREGRRGCDWCRDWVAGERRLCPYCGRFLAHELTDLERLNRTRDRWTKLLNARTIQHGPDSAEVWEAEQAVDDLTGAIVDAGGAP